MEKEEGMDLEIKALIKAKDRTQNPEGKSWAKPRWQKSRTTV